MEPMHISNRWMLRADLAEAMRIVRASGEGVTEGDLERMIKKSSVVIQVAESEERLLGFIAYDMSRVSKIKILSLVVDEPHRRKGVGRALVDLMVSKLNGKRNKVETSVSEYNLPAQLFLRSVGFKAVSASSEADGPSEYRFVYRAPEPAEKT